MKFGPGGGGGIQCKQGTFDTWGHWVHFRFQIPCVSKTAGFRVKDRSRSIQFCVVIVFHLGKQSAKSLGFLL